MGPATNGTAKIKVMLGAEDPMFRLGLRAACQEVGLVVSAEFDDGAEAVLSDPGTPPAVVVVDSTLLCPDPVSVIDVAAAQHRVLVVAAGPLDKPKLLRAGASGFLCKKLDVEELRAAVVAANAGDLYIGGTAADGPWVAEGSRSRLTQRETDVLRLLAAGQSTASVADALHMGQGTVKAHLRNASGKLGARSRAAATAVATRQGLL